MKTRNWHAVNAIQRKSGYHSGKRRPHLQEDDDIDEQTACDGRCLLGDPCWVCVRLRGGK